jgi:hypothetical protein
MQYLSTIVLQSSAVQAVSGTQQAIASLSVPAGEWSINGALWCAVSSGTPAISSIATSISIGTALPGPMINPSDSTVSNVIEPNQAKQAATTVGWVLPLASMYLNTAQATTALLTATVTWTATGAILLYGKVTARGIPIGPTPGFVYLHTTDGTLEGYVNQSMVQYVRPNGTGGSIIQIENRVLDVTEAPDIVAGAT